MLTLPTPDNYRLCCLAKLLGVKWSLPSVAPAQTVTNGVLPAHTDEEGAFSGTWASPEFVLTLDLVLSGENEV